MSALDPQQGREAYARRAWRESFEAFSRADDAGLLAADDLELQAVAAYMLGRDDESRALLERAHHAHLAAGETLRAARCAFWAGMNLALRGETAPAAGWHGRARRLLEREEGERAEHGLLLIPLAFQQDAAGDWEQAAETAARAAALGERFGDDDLFALASHIRGQILLRHGRVPEGLRLLDEAMVAATSGAQSPIVTGIVYCAVILACIDTYDVRRAQQWTDVLTGWCEDQPELVAFRGRCLIHRAEILQLRGDWQSALEEARSAGERLRESFNRSATAQAFYRQGELHRLRGDLAAAEEAYRAASRHGFEPQPGFALLRLAQDGLDAAATQIHRLLGEAADQVTRARLLPAAVEIMVACGDLEAARAACTELEEIATEFGSAMLRATAAHARGMVLLAGDDAEGALAELRRACRGWDELEAPYETARTRVLVARACRALGDGEAAVLELEGARATFAALGAAADAARVGALLAPSEARDTHGLTDRELEVLRLVAGGRSNREIAGALVLSEHTVARHLQNIFRKLGVSSRTAAGAFAHEHGLV